MARPISTDLRERAVARVEAGESRRSVAKAFGVSPSEVIKWTARARRTCDVVPSPMGGGRPKITGEHAAWLLDRVRNGEGFTVRGLVAELADRGLEVSRFAVWRFVRAAGLSWKKNRGRGGAK